VPCQECDGSGNIWTYKEKCFEFNLTEKPYVIVDNEMKALENLIDQLPEDAWNTITEEDLSTLSSTSETAKSAIGIIQEFDKSLDGKDVKLRAITVKMTESMILEDEYQGTTFTIVLAGQAWKFIGKLSNLTRGVAPQKDGTWLITEDTFNSMNFKKELSKMAKEERKDLEKKLKDAEKELSGPQKVIDKIKKDLDKARQNLSDLKQKLDKASEKKKPKIKPKFDDAFSTVERISADLKEAEGNAEAFSKKVDHFKVMIEALP